EINYICNKNELNFEKAKGNRNSKFSSIKVYFHGFNEVKTVKVNGLAKSGSKETYKLMNDMPQFDPIGKGISANQYQLSTIVFSNSKDKISLKW
ncbi:MAG: hypothetical protein ACOVP1_06770, partial [Bacteroidia bacterium]